MSAIHEMSSVAVLPEFDLFSVPPTQVSVRNTSETEYRPASTLSSQAPIEFKVNTSPDQYILLSETYLKLRLKVTLVKETRLNTDKIKRVDYANVVPVNYLLHSIFKAVELTLGNKQVALSPQTYAYRAYIEALLGYSQHAKSSHLATALWEPDVTARQKFIQPKEVNGEVGREVELFGKIHLDLTFQNRAILGGTNMFLKLIPNTPAFYLECPSGYKATVEFTYAGLFLTTQEVTSFLLDGHSKALAMATAKYPITRTEVRNNLVTAGSLDVMLDNVLMGQIPRRVFIACVKHSAFNGNFKMNPYFFEHFNINYIACYVNGIQVPQIAYQPDFENEHYSREYLALYRALDQNGTDVYMKLKPADYSNGNTIFAFQFAPDLSSGCGAAGHVNVIKQGTVRLQLRFSKALTEPINVLMYCEYDSLLEIDQTRSLITDYN